MQTVQTRPSHMMYLSSEFELKHLTYRLTHYNRECKHEPSKITTVHFFFQLNARQQHVRKKGESPFSLLHTITIIKEWKKESLLLRVLPYRKFEVVEKGSGLIRLFKNYYCLRVVAAMSAWVCRVRIAQESLKDRRLFLFNFPSSSVT